MTDFILSTIIVIAMAVGIVIGMGIKKNEK